MDNNFLPAGLPRLLMLAGLALFALGLLGWWLRPWLQNWPNGAGLGWLGRLPGDISWKGNGFSFYFPLATSIVVSVVISLLLYLLRRWGA